MYIYMHVQDKQKINIDIFEINYNIVQEQNFNKSAKLSYYIILFPDYYNRTNNFPQSHHFNIQIILSSNQKPCHNKIHSFIKY